MGCCVTPELLIKASSVFQVPISTLFAFGVLFSRRLDPQSLREAHMWIIFIFFFFKEMWLFLPSLPLPDEDFVGGEILDKLNHVYVLGAERTRRLTTVTEHFVDKFWECTNPTAMAAHQMSAFFFTDFLPFLIAIIDHLHIFHLVFTKCFKNTWGIKILY